MPLVHFFETSFSRTYERDIILVEAVSRGVSGWGEVTAGENPFYNEEWTGSIWPLLSDYIAPRVLNIDFDSAARCLPALAHIRGHYMTRGGVEAAIWDLQARLHGNPLCGKRSAEERAARFLAAFRSAFRIRVDATAAKRSRRNSRPGISESR